MEILFRQSQRCFHVDSMLCREIVYRVKHLYIITWHWNITVFVTCFHSYLTLTNVMKYTVDCLPLNGKSLLIVSLLLVTVYYDFPLIVFSNFCQMLGDSMTGITNHAKKGDLENFCDSVGNFSTSVCGLTEAASQVRECFKTIGIFLWERTRLSAD